MLWIIDIIDGEESKNLKKNWKKWFLIFVFVRLECSACVDVVGVGVLVWAVVYKFIYLVTAPKEMFYGTKTFPKSMFCESFHYPNFGRNTHVVSCVTSRHFWDTSGSIWNFFGGITCHLIFIFLCTFNKLLTKAEVPNETNASADYWTYHPRMIEHDLINKLQTISSVIWVYFICSTLTSLADRRP